MVPGPAASASLSGPTSNLSRQDPGRGHRVCGSTRFPGDSISICEALIESLPSQSAGQQLLVLSVWPSVTLVGDRDSKLMSIDSVVKVQIVRPEIQVCRLVHRSFNSLIKAPTLCKEHFQAYCFSPLVKAYKSPGELWVDSFSL